MSNLLEAGELFEDPIKGRKGKLERLRKVTAYAPEVMVKVSGSTSGAAHVKSHLDYISRNGKVELEDERGEIVKGRLAVSALHQDWMQDAGKRTPKTRDTTSIVLSMPAGTNPISVKESVRRFAQKEFAANYQYVFAFHEDTERPHVHLTVKTLGFDGKRLHIRKGQPQKWREKWVKELGIEGIEAEATTRAERGVVLKGIKQALIHIRERTTSKVDQAKIQEVLNDALGKKKDKPWEEKIKKRQNHVRRAWLQLADEIKLEDPELSKKMVSFVRNMPTIDTERHKLQQAIAQKITGKSVTNKIQVRDEEQER